MGWLLAILALVAVALAAMVRPLLSPAQPWSIGGADTVVKELRREKLRLLRLLKDLDLELESGSLDENEYRELRRGFLIETALINRRLEALGVNIEPELGGRAEGSAAAAASAEDGATARRAEGASPEGAA